MRTSRVVSERPSAKGRSIGAALAALACLGSAVTVLAGTASAEPPGRETFHEETTEVIDDFCDSPGLTVQLERTVDVRGSAQARGQEGLIYFLEHIVLEEVLTPVVAGEPVPGESLRVVERTLTKDLKVTDNGDGTLTVLMLATGTSTLYDSSGKAIARNPGQVRFETLLDHAGTPADPADDVEISQVQVKGSTGRSDDYCEAIIDQLT
jgi:hypothetical protein